MTVSTVFVAVAILVGADGSMLASAMQEVFPTRMECELKRIEVIAASEKERAVRARHGLPWPEIADSVCVPLGTSH